MIERQKKENVKNKIGDKKRKCKLKPIPKLTKMSLRRNSNEACATAPFTNIIFIFKQVGQVQLL